MEEEEEEDGEARFSSTPRRGGRDLISASNDINSLREAGRARLIPEGRRQRSRSGLGQVSLGIRPRESQRHFASCVPARWLAVSHD